MPKIDLDEKQLMEFVDAETVAKIEALEKEVKSLKGKVTRLTRQRDEAREQMRSTGRDLYYLAKNDLGFDPSKEKGRTILIM